MNKILLTLDEAAQLAFIDREGRNGGMLDSNIILVAQLSLLKPLLGGFYGLLEQGRYPGFVVRYLKLPLALWVKSIIVRNSVVSTGSMGATRQASPNLLPAGDKDVALAVAALRSQARVLMENALDHLAQSGELYPEYTPLPRRRQRRIMGGVII